MTKPLDEKPKCTQPNCNNVAQTKGKCKGHGGGNRCMKDGCKKGFTIIII